MLEFIHIPEGCPYYGFVTTLDMTCEEGLCAWVRQPANVVSSLIFFIPAHFIFWQGIREKSEILKAIGLVSLFIAIASTMAHATHLRLLGFADFTFQYLLIYILLWMNSKRLLLHNLQTPWLFSFGLWTLTALLQWFYPQMSLIIYFSLIALLLTSEGINWKRSPSTKYRDFFKCGGLLLIGAVL
ncbi:MAG: hypothetical protein KDD34_07560, partial [Bdellovibrionales bacterium]|nr:hypothetical protein [Bdellovibrionales bacterium]